MWVILDKGKRMLNISDAREIFFEQNGDSAKIFAKTDNGETYTIFTGSKDDAKSFHSHLMLTLAPVNHLRPPID